MRLVHQPMTALQQAALEAAAELRLLRRRQSARTAGKNYRQRLVRERRALAKKLARLPVTRLREIVARECGGANAGQDATPACGRPSEIDG